MADKTTTTRTNTDSISIERFYADNQVKKDYEEVFVTESFVTESGDVIPWKIKPLTFDEHERIINSRNVTVQEKDKRTGTITYRTIETEYIAAICAQAVVFPDLSDKGLQDSFSRKTGNRITSKIELIKNMLTIGELSNLAEVVTEISDLGDTTKFDNPIEQVKN